MKTRNILIVAACILVGTVAIFGVIQNQVKAANSNAGDCNPSGVEVTFIADGLMSANRDLPWHDAVLMAARRCIDGNG
jgi:hypothetical protein